VCWRTAIRHRSSVRSRLEHLRLLPAVRPRRLHLGPKTDGQCRLNRSLHIDVRNLTAPVPGAGWREVRYRVNIFNTNLTEGVS
jgi:hypothetical protein